MAKIPVQKRCGFDPLWEKSDHDHTNVAIRANCGKVVSSLVRRRSRPLRAVNLLQERPIIEDVNRALFAFQFRGHRWTQLESTYLTDADLAKGLSRSLKTLAFADWYNGSGYAYLYWLFDRGKVTEQLGEAGYDIFEDAEPEERQRKLARGWQISDNGQREFFTRRRTSFNVNRGSGFDLARRVVRDIGLYLACLAWWPDDATCKPVCSPFSLDDFSAAYLLLARD